MAIAERPKTSGTLLRTTGPYILALAALGLAIGGAVATGTHFGLVSTGVESLSSSSSSLLGNVGSILPLGFAFGAGMVASVNPCGFAMLPAYLGLYLGGGDASDVDGHLSARLGRAVVIGLVVTAGFVLLFGIAGLIIGAGAHSLTEYFPWVGFSTGIVLALAGAWVMAGRTLYSGFVERLSAKSGDASKASVRGYFAFGLGYGIASLSCTLPIFLAVVGTTLTVNTFLQSAVQFLLYALGMGLVILLLTLGIALFRGALVGKIRRILPYIQPVSSVLLIVAGAYIVYYWLTIGGLLSTFTQG